MRLQRALSKETGIQTFMMPIQDLRAGGREANAEFQYTLQSDDIVELNAWVPRLRRALAALPEITDVNTDADDHGVQTMITLDRDAIARLGLTVSEIDTTLNNAYGQRQISTIYNARNQYRVVMEAAEPYRQSAKDLETLMIVRSDGTRVPLSAVATFSVMPRALSVRHQGQFTATTIAFNLAANISLSQAMDAINYAVLKEGMPVSIIGTFQGTARMFKDTMRDQIVLIVAALLALYIILGILYESYTDSLVIISALPSAGIGALLGLIVCHTEFSIIALLGILLLIGLVMKNAIMMIDFAVVRQRDEGLSPKDAIYQAALLRFRPILMTSMTAMLAAVPLAIGAGDGAELRRPLGIAIIGGLVVSQFLTLYTTPVIYLAVDALKRRISIRKAAIPLTQHD
jgi:multidrug efflux pump